jgi:hypothetical protein
VHKHESPRTLADLDFIRGVETDVFPIDLSGFLVGYSQTELAKLHWNTCGAETPYQGDSLRSVLLDLAERIPTADVNPFLANVQASWLEKRYAEGKRPAHRYATCTEKPTEAPDEPVWPEVAPLTTDEAANAARRRAAPAPLPATGEAAGTGAIPAPRPVRIVMQAQRAGKTSALIFDTADKLWEEAGKPTDMPSVLAVRKKVMDQLEQVGIKRTTCSSTLGAWQKARI